MLVRYQPNTTTITPEQVYQRVNNLFRHICCYSASLSRAIKYQKYDLWFGQGFDFDKQQKW